MRDRHLIVLDLDGTLLTDEKLISKRTKQTLFEARKQGHVVMIATGRPYRASKMYYDQLELNTPIVNFNGAHIHHPLDNDWGNYHTTLSKETTKRIVRACEEFGIKNIIAEVLDKVYFHYHDEAIINLFNLGDPEIQSGKLDELLTEEPTSLLIYPDLDKVNTIREHLTDAHAEVIEHRKWAAPWHVIEIVKKGIHKAVGVERVANYYNIPRERIIAFGDEDNDLEMIEYAGTGVAMDNAIDELKAVSNTVTASNEDDGIAQFLEEALSLTVK
ncbi:Cof-type HAD-IIB family hydrolase [Bacillus tianshenii]|nr:Cof-type HAD-IIB family hydrolase [Bacillus tianshenii]